MNLSDRAARFARERGIDLSAIDTTLPPFDPIAWRVDQQRQALAATIPPVFVGAEPDHPQMAAWVDALVADRSTAGSVFLVGPTGGGKSHQAYGAVQAAVLRFAARGETIVWRHVTHPRFNEELRPRPDGSHATAIDRYVDADLLVFDDLGAGKQSEWTGDSLYRLVDTRWAYKRPTIYTTNLDPRTLGEAVGERIASRVFDAMRVIVERSDRRRAGAR